MDDHRREARDSERPAGASPSVATGTARADLLTVMAVDDDAESRMLLAATLTSDDGFRFCVPDLARWVEDVRAMQPDALLLGVGLDGRDTLDVVPSLIRWCPATMVVTWSSAGAADVEPYASRSGVFACYERTSLAHLPARLVADHARFQLALDGERIVAPVSLRRGSSTMTADRPSDGSSTNSGR